MGAFFDKFVTGQGQLPPALQTDPTTGQPMAAAATSDQPVAPATPSMVVPGKPVTVLRQNAPPNAFGQFVSPPVTVPLDSTAPPASGPPPTPPTPGYLGPVIDYAKNIGTGLESAAANVAGTPRFLQDLIHKYIPQALQLPDLITTAPASTIRQKIVGQTGLDYVPSTAGGRIAQRAAEFGGAGILGGPETIPFAAMGGAAQQTGQELGLPDWLNTTLGIATPILAHTGAGTVSLLRRPTTVAGQEAGAGQVLREIATNPNAPINPPIIPGAPQTFGMATDDLGTRAFERSRFSTTAMAPEWTRIQQGVSQATTDALNQGVSTVPNRAGSVMQMENTASDMHQHMLDTKDAGLRGETAAWNPVDPNNTLSTPIAPLKAGLQLAKDALGVTNADLYPSYVDGIINKLEGLGPNAPFNEVKRLHTRVLNDLRDAQSGIEPDRNLAHALTPVEQTLRNTMDNIVSSDPAQQAALDTARQTSANFHMIYDNKNVQRALSGPPSKAGNILNTPEGIDAYHAATGGSPAAMDAARKYFMAGLARDAINQDGTLSASAFNNYLRDNQGLLRDQRFFTPEQADTLEKAGQQLNSLQQTPRIGMGGQSPTYQLLTGGEQAKALVGKPAQVAANIADKLKTGGMTWIGHHLGGWPGAAAGWGLSHIIPDFTYEKAGQNVLNLVDKALADPALADRLRQIRLSNPLSYSSFAPAAKAATVPILLGGGSR